MSKIAFIGAGNMAEALMNGLISSGVYKPADVTGADISKQRLEYLNSKYGIKTTDKNSKAAKQADIIVLSVKPHHIHDVLEEINGGLEPDKIIISIAAGISLSSIAQSLENKTKLIRVMPNTPALVLAGASVIYCNENVTAKEKERVKKIFESVSSSSLNPS